jgi:hypothetical protein
MGTPMSKDIGTSEDLRSRILDWLRSNDIEPNDIPTNVHPSLVGDQLTTEVFQRNERGRIQFDPSIDGVAKATKTFTITVPPPPDVAEWLRPRCSECGR